MPAAPYDRRGLPYVGRTFAYLRDPMAMMRRTWEEHGPVSEADFLGTRYTMVLGPDACAEVLRNPRKDFASGPAWNRLVGPFFDRGLMFLDFEEHHRHRRLMQAAFTRQRLEGYVAALGPAVSRGLDAWSPRPDLRAYPALKQLTLDLATEVFMGGTRASREELDAVNRAFIDCVQAATALLRVPVPGTRWGRAHAGRRLLEQFFRAELAGRREGAGDDLFSVLARLDDDGWRLSDEDVVNHMIFLLMAAHDTSTITVSTLMRHLGEHPEWQQRLREEAAGLPDHPTLDQLDGLTDLDRAIREALRLVPPVPTVVRHTVRDTEVLGVDVPAHRHVAVLLHFSHHMPEYWDEPGRFDPDRFSPERAEDKRHRHAWTPFGGGVHKCLGMVFAHAEVKLVVHQLLRRFSWQLPPGYVDRLDYHSLPFPRDGQPLALADA